MSDPNRDAIMALNRKRRDMRFALTGDVAQAKKDLHPRNLMQRWKVRKREQLAALSASAKHNLANNAPLIGLAGAAILLFVARKPISKAYIHLRNKAQQSKDRIS